jgi:hypothetical protein
VRQFARGAVAPLCCPQPGQQIEDTHNLGAITGHLTIADLPPAQQTVPIDDEGGAPGHVAGLIEDAIGTDDAAMDVAQQREGKGLGFGVGGVREGAIGADGQDGGTALSNLRLDLDQAEELRRSNAAPVETVKHQDDVLSSEG